MGHPLAHENEAPFSLDLANFFVKSFCPPCCCSQCGHPVQCDNGNKNLQTLRSSVSGQKLASPILFDELPVNRVPDRRNYEKVRRVPEGIQNLGIATISKKVLLEDVREQCDEKSEGGLYGMRGTDTNPQGHKGREVLLQNVRESVDVSPQRINKDASRDSEGICHDSLEVSPICKQERVRDGAQTSNGKASGKVSRKNGSCASHKRKEERQQDRKPASNEQKRTRLFAEAKKPIDMPALWTHNSYVEICQTCGFDISQPGGTRTGKVLDIFCGSSTTGQSCMENGRNYVGIDLRQSQIELSKRRLGLKCE